MTIQILLAGGLLLLLAMFASGLMLIRDLNRQERRTNRVRVIHGERVENRSGTDLAVLREAIMGGIARVGQPRHAGRPREKARC